MTLIWPVLLVTACCAIGQGSEQCARGALTYLTSIRRISIPSQAIRQNNRTTFYTIVLTLSGDESVVQASRRYSEFCMLRQELTLVPSDGTFPKKQISDWACTLWKSLESCVRDRRLGLEAYLNRALHHLNQTSDKEKHLQARILTTFMLKNPDDVNSYVNSSVSTNGTGEPAAYKQKSAHEQQRDIGEPVAYEGPGPLSKDDLIKEYYDATMGVAFSMVTKTSWEWGGSWGLASDPRSVPDGKHRHVSIMTHKQDMVTFQHTAYGLIYNITPETNFWKHFMAIKIGDKKGGICGGPGDGGSQTNPSQRVLPESMGKDYEWFASEKKRILDKYNTVYKAKDYNEFIAMGTSSLALAGILHYTKGLGFKPTDEQMCVTLRNVRGGKWPIYAYDTKSLKFERYLKC